MNTLTNSELKAKEAKFNLINNENGEGFNAYSNELERRGVEEFKAAVRKENEEWTLEVTIERRAQFNSKKPTGSTLKKIEAELGYTMLSLQNAVKRHGL